MDFIPLAEETGLIIPIGDWVLRQACQQNKAWQEAGYKPIPISVNVSLRQFMQIDFVKLVENVLQQTGLAPQYLELEITESMTMDITYTERVLASLKALGIKVSMDDFGTGYSSLSYLRTLPINKLKIDQAFIRNLDKKNKAIVRTIISLAYNLRINVIAEGVERQEHVDFLKKHNCFQAQGYLFSKPISKEELDRHFTTFLNGSALEK
jgi:EAL domain-containing protein (putative c-di-GMP-specific phosphodiesterase class I)